MPHVQAHQDGAYWVCRYRRVVGLHPGVADVRLVPGTRAAPTSTTMNSHRYYRLRQRATALVAVGSGVALLSCGARPDASTGRDGAGIPSATSQPTPIIDSPWAAAQCNTRTSAGGLPGFSLEAAFQSTAGEVAAWQTAGGKPSMLARYLATMRVAVCYLAGPWEPPPGIRQAFQSRGQTPDRGIMFITDDRHVIQGPIGDHRFFRIERPTAPSATTTGT